MTKIPDNADTLSLQASLISLKANADATKAIEDALQQFDIEDIVQLSDEAKSAQKELSPMRKYQLDNGAAPNVLSDLLYLAQKKD
jgi:hypothetical protein